MSGAQSVIVATGSVCLLSVLVAWVWRPWRRPAHEARREVVLPDAGGWISGPCLDTVPRAPVGGRPPWELLAPEELPESGWPDDYSATDRLLADALDWREQTTADLSPEALDALEGWNQGDPVLVITSGPDQYPMPGFPGYDPPPLIEFDGPWGPVPRPWDARCDTFVARMVADHQQWLAAARERWAVA